MRHHFISIPQRRYRLFGGHHHDLADPEFRQRRGIDVAAGRPPVQRPGPLQPEVAVATASTAGELRQ